jgi:hypothetical protein
MAKTIGSVRILKNDFKRLANACPASADRALRAAVQVGITDVKLSFGTSPAPSGGPPGVDTGALRASIHEVNLGYLTYAIADGVEYGVDLELGSTRHGNRTWPCMGPMMQRLERQIPDIFNDFLT